MNTTDFNLLLKQGKLISLSKGIVLDKMELVRLYAGIATFCIFPILSLVMIMVPAITWNAEVFTAMLLSDILALAVISYFLHTKFRSNKVAKHIELWLDDAVEVEAYSEKIGEIRSIFATATKIQVLFIIGGVKYIKQSTIKLFGTMQGYAGWFNKYANRNVTVLYSPKYDEVMLVKDVTDFAI